MSMSDRRRGRLDRHRRRLPRRPAARAAVAGPAGARPRRPAARRAGRPVRRARPDARRSRPGSTVTATITGLGSVTATFSEEAHAMSDKTKVAIIGSGNIGTDLMIKVLRTAKHLEMGAMVGIDPASDGLARAARLGVPTTAEGVDGLIALPGFDDIEIVFDATSAKAHAPTPRGSRRYGKRLIDLTPGGDRPVRRARGQPRRRTSTPPNVNMVTCGGQATIPIVAAVSPGRARWRTPRSSPRSPRSPPGPAPAPTSTSSPRPPRRAIVERRRRAPRQGDHRPQPRRAAADHARHRLLPRRRSGPGDPRRDPRRRSRRWSPTSRPTCPATGSSSRCRSPQIPADQPVHTLRARRRRPRRPTRCRCSSRSRAPRTTSRRTPATSTS